MKRRKNILKIEFGQNRPNIKIAAKYVNLAAIFTSKNYVSMKKTYAKVSTYNLINK